MHGDRIERLGPWLRAGDPRADAVVEGFARLPLGEGRRQLHTALERGIQAVPKPVPALVALFEEVEQVPMWLDWSEVERGAAVYRSLGLLAQAVLISASLPRAYASPAGCKPLTFTGRLVQRAFRRMAETGHFALETVTEGGLRRDSAGFKITLHVRLMHAQVRRLLQASKRWDPEWGTPLNQVDLLGTNLTFSVVMMEGLRRLGLRLSPGEIESVMHLWRYSGHLIGVEPCLQAATLAEGTRLFDLITRAQAGPDDDSRALTRALLDVVPEFFGQPRGTRAARAFVSFFEGLLAELCGNELAKALGIGRTPWRYALPWVRLGVVGCSLGRRLPGGRSLAERLGTIQWKQMVERSLRGEQPTFDSESGPPQKG